MLFVLYFRCKLSQQLLVGSVPPRVTLTAAKPLRIPTPLGPAEFTVHYDPEAINFAAIHASDSLIGTSLITVLDKSVALCFLGLVVPHNADTFNLAYDLELLVKSIL